MPTNQFLFITYGNHVVPKIKVETKKKRLANGNKQKIN